DTAGSPLDVIFPATGEVVARLHTATPDLIERAVASAKTAQSEWAQMRPVDRARLLRRAHDIVQARNDEIARMESIDTGRCLSETLYVDAVSVAEALEFYAGIIPAYNGEAISLGASFAYTRREPLGVCVGIGAWNYPFQCAGWKSAPALAAGNAMVFKPSENTPLSALVLAEIFKEAGLPDGLFNVLQGRGDVGQALVAHADTAKVSVTGSVPTGKKVLGLAGTLMKHGTMELGGKSPLILFEDAQLDNAISGALMANFYSSGQVCTNGTRVFIHRSIHDQVVESIVQRANAIRIGNPLDPEAVMGPLANKAQQDKVLSYIAAGISEGATLRLGGKVPQVNGMEEGFWIEPTVFTDVTDDMQIAREEIFGPVMSVLVFDTEEEVLSRANETEFGLAAGVFTRDIQRAHRVAAALQAGVCWINNYNLAPVEVPFGGVKSSGIGRECAMAALDHYTQIKSVFVESGDVVSVF
ncbi:MAG: betaine-aldehyde dehydrogenase, partial [Albidovulum sp.]|uniref:betaine-aldehyde dehydrogenase n=1 Tax=Albidovulum sp. TaxID=1872424 RepID=UPI003C8177DF